MDAWARSGPNRGEGPAGPGGVDVTGGGQPLWLVALDRDARWLEQMNAMFLESLDLRMAGGASRVTEVARLVRVSGARVILVEQARRRPRGLAAATAFVRQFPSARVYLTATASDRDLVEESRLRGICGVVRKPFIPAELLRRLQDDRPRDRCETVGRTGEGAHPGVWPEAPPADAPRTFALGWFRGGVGRSLAESGVASAVVSRRCRPRPRLAWPDADQGLGGVTFPGGVPGAPLGRDWWELRGAMRVDPVVAMRDAPFGPAAGWAVPPPRRRAEAARRGPSLTALRRLAAAALSGVERLHRLP